MKRKVTYPRIVWRQRRYRVHNFIVSVVLLVIIALGSFVLRDVLSVYEKNQPRHIVDEALAEVNAGDYTLFLHSQLSLHIARCTRQAYCSFEPSFHRKIHIPQSRFGQAGF